MISKEEVLRIHKVLIEEFGGGEVLRDESGLESALGRIYQTFDGKELYETAEEKASAIIESILINHPFIDGNKRTGYVLMRLLLMEYNKDIEASEDEKYEFVIEIASGKRKYDQIKDWIIAHLK